MRTKCYSVRLKSLTPISSKCYKAVDWQGNEDLIPSSQIFGQDYGVSKSDAYWISAWILEKKGITYTCKKEHWFEKDCECGEVFYDEVKITISKKIPPKRNAIERDVDKSLLR